MKDPARERERGNDVKGKKHPVIWNIAYFNPQGCVTITLSVK